MATQVEIENEPTAEPRVRSAEWSVCNQVPHLSNGDKAALRRMYLTNSYGSAGVVQSLLYRAKVALPVEENARFESWRLMAHTAAIISGTIKRFPHSEKRSLGRSLYCAGLKKNTVLRLLSARGPALPDQVRRIARILGQGDSDCIPTNLTTLRELADPDPVIAEDARRLIARDFYAAADADERKPKGTTK